MSKFMDQFKGLRPTPRAVLLGEILGASGMFAGVVLIINLVGVHCG